MNMPEFLKRYPDAEAILADIKVDEIEERPLFEVLGRTPGPGVFQPELVPYSVIESVWLLDDKGYSLNMLVFSGSIELIDGSPKIAANAVEALYVLPTIGKRIHEEAAAGNTVTAVLSVLIRHAYADMGGGTHVTLYT